MYLVLYLGHVPSEFEGDDAQFIYLNRMVTYSKNAEEGPPVAKIKEVLILMALVVPQEC